MVELERPVAKVWRRLRFQRFLHVLAWAMALAVVAATLVIACERLLRQPVPGPLWLPLAVAAGLSLLISSLIALLGGASRLDAAVALDKAFHLDERVSSAYSLPPNLRSTPAGQALIEDATAQSRDLEFRGQFRPRLPRALWITLGALVPALALLLLPAQLLDRLTRRASAATPLAAGESLASQTEALSKRLEQAREQLEEADVADLDKTLDELQAAAREIAELQKSDPEQALLEMNKFTDALKQRQDELGSSEEIARQLQTMSDLADAGPAEQFARELARGDFEAAAEKVGELREKLASGALTDQEKAELRTQLSQLQEKLDQMANLEERRKALEQALKSGGLTRDQYNQEMARLDQQAQDLQKLKQLAEKLGQCQQAMAQGDMQKAADALGMTQEQLQEMAAQMQELEILDQALVDMIEAKAGPGEDLNMLGDAPSAFGGMGRRMGESRSGQGRGQGAGDRAEAPDDTAAYGTKVPQQMGQGSAVATGFGPPRQLTPGQSVAEISGSVDESAAASAAEAMSNQRIPRSVQQHVQGYFDRLRQDR